MKRAILIIAWPVTLILSALAGYELAESQYERIIGTVNELAKVRDMVQEDNCNGRIANILNQVSMECFGTWTTADGPITIYPTKVKEVP